MTRDEIHRHCRGSLHTPGSLPKQCNLYYFRNPALTQHFTEELQGLYHFGALYQVAVPSSQSPFIVWYGSQKEIKEKKRAQSLVAYFCSRVKEAFDPIPLLSMRTSFWDDGTTVYRLAKDILLGKGEWLEDGIIKMPLF